MKKIYLHAELADEFGQEPFNLVAPSPTMIIRGMICQLGEQGAKFRKQILKGAFEFVCIKNGKKTYIHDEMTATMVVDADEIHITPVAAGSGRFGQIILGVVLIVAGFALTAYGVPIGTSVTGAGLAMVAGGIVQLLTPVPNVSALSNERPDARPSFVFNGPVNVYEQGGPVQLVYGRIKCGTTIVSAGFDVERIAFNVNCGPRYNENDCDGPKRGGDQDR